VNQASLMFSGGVDSTAAALKLAERYDLVHLLTFDNGYGTAHMQRARRRAEELHRLSAPRLHHTLISIKPLFERLVINTLEQDYERYASGFIWCLGCKLAMHSRAIAYDLWHGINTACDGSSSSTPEMVEQTPLSLLLFRELYAEYGIDFSTPVFLQQRVDSDALLAGRGFKLGLPLLGRRLANQPSCRPGELYYLPFVLFRQPPLHDKGIVRAFLEEKFVIARRIIAELRESGLDGAT